MPEPSMNRDMASLANEIEARAESDNLAELERKLCDFASWYYKQRNEYLPTVAENPLRHIEFLEKSVDIQTEVIALLVARIQKLETGRSSSLFLPSGMILNG